MGMTMQLFQLDQIMLNEIIENPELFFEIDPSSKEFNNIEIDKSWEGLKLLLSKSINNDFKDLTKLISSEQEISGIEELISDLYNVNFLNAMQVQKLTPELLNLTLNDISKNFDFKEMNEIEIYGNPFDTDSLTYFLKYFEKIKEFYSTAMKNKKAVISYIS